MVFVNIFSEKEGEIENFLSRFYNTDINLDNSLFWKKKYDNPVEIAEIIGIYIDNSDNFSITMWICLDKHIYVHVNELNANELIKYIYERFPY